MEDNLFGDAPEFDAVIAALRTALPGTEDASFAWDDVAELLYLPLSNTDAVPARKTNRASNATSIELTDPAVARPSKVIDFFPTLAFSERYPERRIAVSVRWRLENVVALARRFTDVMVDPQGAGWIHDTLQIRRAPDRNDPPNPGIMFGYENDLQQLRAVLGEDDVLVIARRTNATSYEAFGIAAADAPPIGGRKRLLVRPGPVERRQLWTFARPAATPPAGAAIPPSGPKAQEQIDHVVDLARRHGASGIIALAGVPGTGKTYAAERVALALAGHRNRVEVVQFHAAYAYEEFVQGLDLTGQPTDGALLRINARAGADEDNTYVLVIEEFTRADLSSVLGELLTYVEYRDRSVTLPYSRQQFRVADNLIVLATFNPTDRSALEIDTALLRRLRIVDFLPSPELAVEMLEANGLDPEVAAQAAAVLRVHRDDERWAFRMPFGHGIYAKVTSITDLEDLWDQRIRRFLFGPWENHPYAEAIAAAYPWQRRGDAGG